MSGFDAEMVRAFDTAFAPVAVLLAMVVGAAHALRPGHGKTMVAAYLLGEQGSRRHAVVLAVTVAAMHTASVLVLGLLWWFTARRSAVSIDAVTRWGQLAVAMIVLALGVVITRRRWAVYRRSRVVEYSVAEHGHGHGHAHGRGRGHEHEHQHAPPPGAAPWSRAGLVGIASVGALMPSPSAFLVLVSGLLTGRTGLALGMVAAFGVGLAATVLATGLVVLAGRDWLDERAVRYGRLGRIAAHLPLLGAVAVLTGGCVLAFVAVSGL